METDLLLWGAILMLCGIVVGVALALLVTSETVRELLDVFKEE